MFRNLWIKSLLLLAGMAFAAAASAQSSFSINTRNLKNGDLIFQEEAPEKNDDGIDLTKAIAESTSGKDDISYTHVGIVIFENGVPFVIEASTSGVRETHLEDFVARSEFEEGKPLIGIARIKDTIAISPSDAALRAKKLVGKGYDYYYKPDNGLYYCSELVYECYLLHDGTHFFEAESMSFEDKEGHISDEWNAHFNKLGVPVPQGMTGTNPGYMSKCQKLFFLYCPPVYK